MEKERQLNSKLNSEPTQLDRSDSFSAKDSIGREELPLKVDVTAARKYLDARIREAVQDVLQVFLAHEATVLCGANKYERTEARKDVRNGVRIRRLVTKAGEVVLKVPRLRQLAFTTAIVERYQRRECSIDEALIEMYLAGVSTRKIQDITEALWGGKVSADQVSTLNEKVFERLEAWRNRAIVGTYPYVFCDGFVMSRRWDNEVKNVSVLLAVGVSCDGRREVLGVAEGCKEDKESWLNFLRWLKQRGLAGVKLIISDRCLGLVAAAKEVFPDAAHERCVVHFYRNVLSKVPRKDMREVAQGLKAIHAQESAEEALAKADRLVEKYGRKFPAAMKVVKDGVIETLSYYKFPSAHWRFIRTTNIVERLIREIRRRTDVVGAFPDSKSAMLLVCARVQWVTERSWGPKRYMNMEPDENEVAESPKELENVR